MSERQERLQNRLQPEIREFRDGCRTLQLATVDSEGNPTASYAPFVLQEDGYYVLISEIARHARNLQQVPKVSLMLIEDETGARELFARKRLTFDAVAEVVAGVPPDYFSATGQRWGNPLYNWPVMARSGYRWWKDRVAHLFQQVDVVRLDHFRGFEAHWEIPATEPTAVAGQWQSGPGLQLFAALQEELGPLAIIAEDLGLITPEVTELREVVNLVEADTVICDHKRPRIPVGFITDFDRALLHASGKGMLQCVNHQFGDDQTKADGRIGINDAVINIGG